VMSACTRTPSASSVKVTVPLTLLSAVECSTAIAFNGAADFGTGDCASAAPAASDKHNGVINDIVNEFMLCNSYFVVPEESSRVSLEKRVPIDKRFAV